MVGKSVEEYFIWGMTNSTTTIRICQEPQFSCVQIMEWTGATLNMKTEDWGWHVVDGTNQPAATPELLDVIYCCCNTDCNTKRWSCEKCANNVVVQVIQTLNCQISLMTMARMFKLYTYNVLCTTIKKLFHIVSLYTVHVILYYWYILNWYCYKSG